MINLVELLMTEIGLEFDCNNNIIDQDNGNLIIFKGKTLKGSYNPQFVPFIGKNDLLFEPITSFKIMQSMFSYHLTKVSMEQNRYFSVVYPVNLPDQRTYIVIKEGNIEIKSLPYLNPCLAYLDLILRISGEYSPESINFYEFDQDIRN